MKKGNVFLVVGFILASLFLATLVANPVAAQESTEAKLVKIGPDYEGNSNKLKGFHLDPATLYIRKKTVVVWLNGVPVKEIQVVFNEGKTCRDVTANPNLKIPGFFLDSSNCYVTSFLPYLATTTLQFVDVGTYKYKVTTEDGKMTAEGKIIVTK